MVEHNREVLVDVLVHHWPNENNACFCGWNELGKSHSEHVANVYEVALHRQECIVHGHSWNVVEDMTGPVALICGTCGQSRDVVSM